MRTLSKLCFGLCLTMLSVASTAWSATSTTQHPSFTGKWVLDVAASDSMDAIMEAQGRSRMERMMAKNMVVTQNITQTEKQVTVEVESAASNQTEVLLLDGSETTMDTPRAGKVTTYTNWGADGVTLVTHAKMKLKNGESAEMIARRKIIDGGKTLSMKVELHLQNGQVLTANRILRKS